MNDDLIQRLYYAETDFFAALVSGTDMLTSYSQTWSTLLVDLSSALLTGNVCNETLSLAYSVASRISNIASCYLDVKIQEENSSALLYSDFDTIIHQMHSLDLNSTAKPDSPPQDGCPGTARVSSSLATSTSTLGSSSPVFATAYQWLLDNLHNPYPTAEVKAQIAATSSCQVSSINSWFINARRRIGWTALRRNHFSNCMADMLDAAYRALVEENPHRPLSPELRHSFIAVKVAAEGLYSSTLSRSTLAGDLDVIVKDVMEEDMESVRVGKRSNADKGGVAKDGDSYPSPDPSIAASPLPALSNSFTDESEQEDVVPPIVTGSKRCRSSIERVDELSSADSRPAKRLRASATSWTCLPSPPSSTAGIDIPPDDNSPESSPFHPSLAETIRVLPPSDPATTSHRNIVAGLLPRSHIENEDSIDDWFNANFETFFDIPPPVDASKPDLSAPWEIELFKNYSIPGSPKHAPKCSPASTVEAAIPAPTDLSDLDSLLQSICNDSFVPPSNVLSSIIGDCYTTPLDSSLLDISQTNIDWVSLLNGTEPYQPTICSTLSQYPTDSRLLPEIDLSMPQLPYAMHAVNSERDFTSKQAKLYQLHTMQEAVRRMEQELRSEGVVV